MKNYIEVEHSYVDEDGFENVDVFCAVRPTPSRIVRSEDMFLDFLTHWVLLPGESGVRVYDRNEIVGLRKLLDAVEEQFVREEKYGEIIMEGEDK